MRRLIIFFLIGIHSIFSFSQKEKLKFPFNEAVLSMNKTPDFSSSHEGYYGFGFGLNRSLRDTNRVGVIVGIHFNHTRQYVNGASGGRFASFQDILFNINTLTIPYSVRFKMGKKNRLFFELGAHLDILVFSKTSYIYSGYLPGNSPGTGTSFGDKDNRVSNSIRGVNPGLHAGIGKILAVSNQEFLLKADVSIGLVDYVSKYFGNYMSPPYASPAFYKLTLGYRFNKNAANTLTESWLNENWK